MSHTNDAYAREIIRAGHDQGITPRGIVIAFATVYVESNWIMWANHKVPESLRIPHERVGNDGHSVGLFQQQVVWGNGAWWWGDAATCMDPYKSATLFFQRLKARDYNHGDPGAHAQAIQRSAYPDRYGQRMAEAQRYYDRIAATSAPPPITVDPLRPAFNEFPRWSPNNSSRNGTKVDAFFLHTQEGGGGDSAAEDLAKWMERNQVSYHYTISQASDGGVTVVDIVDTDRSSWSVLDANARSINLCFAGSRAAWTRQQWMHQSNAIDVAAYLAVQDARKYGFTPKVIPPPYTSRLPGISDHRYVTRVLGIGTHWDVGDGFPWDVFAAAVDKYANPQTGGDDPLSNPDVIRKINELHAALCGEERSHSLYSSPDPETPGWRVPQLVRHLDGHDHERHVETQARRGDLNAISLIVRAARGEGRFTDQAAKDRAARALATIPTEHLEAWEARSHN